MVQTRKIRLAAVGGGKKTVLAAAMLGIASGVNLAAQTTAGPVGSGQSFQMDAKSVQSQYSASRFPNVVDNYINVINWQIAGIDGLFGFTGGSGGAQNADFKVGFAKALGSGLVGVYFSGNLVSGEGGDIGQPKEHVYTLNDNLTLLVGNTTLGAFRFDAIFAGTSLSADDDSTEKKPFVTTIQWGHRIPLGQRWRLRPSIATGMKWAYASTNDSAGTETTVHGGDGAGGIIASAASKIPAGEGAFYAKLAATVDNLQSGWSYAADYALTAGLGSEKETKTGDVTTTEKQNGAFWHIINVFAVKMFTPVDKLSLILRPNVQVGLYSWKNGSLPDFVNQNGDTFAFEIKPGIQFGLRYTLKNNVAFYTGLTLTLLDYQYVSKDSGADNADEGSAWKLGGIALGGGANVGFALTFAPIPGIAVELGISNQALAPTQGTLSFDLSTWEGSLLVRCQSLPKQAE